MATTFTFRASREQAQQDGARYRRADGLIEGPYWCAHCRRDMTIAGKPDTGGDCPACRKRLCRHCAGSWC